jgi:CarD family transcriptional regulator
MPVAKKIPAAARKGAVKTPSAAKAAEKRAAKKAPAAKPGAAKAPAKQPAAAKVTVKKPEAGKAAARKPAAPKPAAGKAAPARKPPEKKAVAPKPAPAKKPAEKAPPKKAAAKKPAEKAAPAPRPPRPAKPAPSPFKVGDKVVYPHHGAAVIVRKEKQPYQGQRTDYFVLQLATDQLTLKVPVHKAVDQGVRPVISQTVARKVLATFKLPPEEAGANWSRWYKLLTEKINSGDIFQVAEVVRDLTYAQQTKGISPALKRMLSKARLILASELRFALDVSEEEAMRRLDKSLPKIEVFEEF